MITERPVSIKTDHIYGGYASQIKNSNRHQLPLNYSLLGDRIQVLELLWSSVSLHCLILSHWSVKQRKLWLKMMIPWT